MRTNLFSSNNGARSGVQKLAILLTDGQSTYHDGTLKEAELAKDAGITIIAVGIGQKVSSLRRTMFVICCARIIAVFIFKVNGSIMEGL